MAGQSEVIQLQSTINRYLLHFPRSHSVFADVHSFTGEEALSKPYRYTIRFTSSDFNIPVGAVLNQMVEFYLRAPNPKASWHGESPWLPVRQINGVVTGFTRLKSSSMAFDLAIGQCRAFDYQAGKFWEGLLHRADWRDPQNGNADAKEYYRSGKLPEAATKNFMNKPAEVLPENVINQFNHATEFKPSRDLSVGNQVITNLQWDMPKAKSDAALAKGE